MIRRGSRAVFWRLVHKRHWHEKDPNCADHIRDAASDFKLRPNETYLSFYAASDDDEGRRVAVAFSLLREEPDKIDFILFPREALDHAGIDVIHRPEPELPEFLCARHWGTVGPQHEPNIEFTRRLLGAGSLRLIRLTSREVIAGAKLLVAEFPSLKDCLSDGWRKELLCN